MAGFNISVGSDDDELRPVDPNTIPQGEEVAGIEAKQSKARLILEKRIRDFEKAVEKIQIRLKSQVLTTGAMTAQRARSASTPERLDEVISGMMGKQQNRIQGLEVDLLKTFDTIKTWIKTTGGTQDDLDYVEAIYETLQAGELENAPAKVQELMDSLKEVSLKEMEARNRKKQQAKDDLEAKRAKKIADAEARKAEKARLKELEQYATAEATLARNEYVAGRAPELELNPFELLTATVDKILLMGRRGKVSGEGPKSRKQQILDDAQEVFDKVFKEKSDGDLPDSATVEASKAKAAKQGTKGLDDAGGLSMLSKAGAMITTALVVDQIISSLIAKTGEKLRAVTSGDPQSVTGAVTGSSLPGNYVGKALTEIVGTLDVIAKNTEQKTAPFSPELLNASINRQLIFLEQNMLRGERLGSVLADISTSRTRLEVASQKAADRIIETFGPTLSRILDSIALILDATLLMADLFKGFFKELGSGNLNIFSPGFWTSVLIDAMVEAAKRSQPTPKITGDIEAFFNNRAKGSSGANTNIPKGILP